MTSRVTRELSRQRSSLTGMGASVAALGLPNLAAEQMSPSSAPLQPTLFTNLRLFDGKSTALRSGLNVFVGSMRR
jgi:hypothetical protein